MSISVKWLEGEHEGILEHWKKAKNRWDVRADIKS